ncbi:hypothetical protein [Streptomyces lavendofoliae]|uniref:Uncharacterized protein n=1 Tax=Streptomyces lavendofoliae TaxID=67314 RepID=A0A918I276_9ACTN|nr:hypothetical protein [Streptomyces lavendofoliae]GGU59023.1 hypothetical protein GCM10010274_54930 [Streptomyces lavendofoliae]
MNQLGDKPEEVRRRLEDEKRRGRREHEDGPAERAEDEPGPAAPKGPLPGDALRERHPDAQERQ